MSDSDCMSSPKFNGDYFVNHFNEVVNMQQAGKLDRDMWGKRDEISGPKTT